MVLLHIVLSSELITLFIWDYFKKQMNIMAVRVNMYMHKPTHALFAVTVFVILGHSKGYFATPFFILKCFNFFLYIALRHLDLQPFH